MRLSEKPGSRKPHIYCLIAVRMSMTTTSSLWLLCASNIMSFLDAGHLSLVSRVMQSLCVLSFPMVENLDVAAGSPGKCSIILTQTSLHVSEFGWCENRAALRVRGIIVAIRGDQAASSSVSTSRRGRGVERLELVESGDSARNPRHWAMYSGDITRLVASA